MSDEPTRKKTLEEYSAKDIERLFMDAVMTMPEVVLEGYDVVAVLIKKSDSVTSIVTTEVDGEKTRKILRLLYDRFYAVEQVVTIRNNFEPPPKINTGD